MTVFRNDGQFDSSNVRIRWTAGLFATTRRPRLPRMRHIDYGLGVLTPAAFAPYVDGEPLDLARVYQHLLAAGQLAGLRSIGAFLRDRVAGRISRYSRAPEAYNQA